ncbi:MAG: DUF5916 domain-containing protein [Candidatus Latescibacterota bacterium]
MERRCVSAWFVAAGVVLGLAPRPSLAQTLPEPRTATAARASPHAPRIDGVLDDAAWQQAPLQEGFQQRDPAEGEPASERTAFQVAYDEQALYVGVRCFDCEPSRVVRRLTRRDGEVEADWVRVSLDPRLDRQTGVWFCAYASGAVADGVYSADQQMDPAWDGVWEVQTALDAEGWTAEYRIPYHALRFSPGEQHTWGLNVERHISRKQERAHWSLIRRGETGLVSRFGRLEEMGEVRPPLHVEFIPYTMGRALVDGGADWFGNAGVDLRYGITSGTSLNATVNPDFGQVEADPATLNLTAYEEFFPERRPFFVEGAATFRNPDYDVFHSRRIGRPPAYFALPDGAEEVDRPETTTILGAVKLTGKTQGKTTFGLLDAVTAAEDAHIARLSAGQRIRQEQRVEPLTHYFVGRLAQDVLRGTSKVGVMGTAVERRGGPSAYVGAADWDLRYRDDTYVVSGTAIASRAGGGEERHSGYIAHLELDKRGGWLEAEAGAAALSRGTDLNDLGYLRRGNLLRHWYDVGLFRHAPQGPFQRYDVGLGWDLEWNYDGLLLTNGVSASWWADLRSYWAVHLHVGRDLGAMDDDYVLDGGPVIRRPGEGWVHAQVETDDRRSVRFSVRPEYRRHDGGRSHLRGLRATLEVQPAPSMWFAVSPSFNRRRDDAHWVEATADPDGTLHQVYGELVSRTLDLTTRGRVSFTPRLSLEVYLQPFLALGEYRRFKELLAWETYRFAPLVRGDDLDFHERSLRSNLVLRWEFRPGSMLYAVWSQARSAALEEVSAEDLELRPLSRLRSSFTDAGTSVFLVKVSYWHGQ